MASEQILEEKVRDVRNFQANFRVVAGPLVSEDIDFKDILLLEIHYQDSLETHRIRLGANSFNSDLCDDYADAAHKLAEEFCTEHGMEMGDHLNSIPQYQATVVKKK